MGERGFQQRWELRRNEGNGLDSSFDGTKSSGRQLLQKNKLVSSLNSVGDGGSSKSSRFQQKNNGNPRTGGQIDLGISKKCRTRREFPAEVDLQKDETSVHGHVPLDDLKNLMESLLKDLKVTRGDLLKWMLEEMQKLVADLTCPEPKIRKRGHAGEKVQLQQMKKSKKVQDQHEEPHKECMQFQHPNNSEKSTRIQHRANFGEPVLAQQQSNFQELQEQDNTNRKNQNDFKYAMKPHNCNNISLVRFPEGIIAAGSAHYFNAFGDRVDSRQSTELIASSKKNKGDSLSMCANPNLQKSPDHPNGKVQSHKTDKSVVLAIEAQNGKGGSLKRSGKGKKTLDRCNDHYQLPEDQGGNGQAMTTAATGTKGKNLGSSVVQNFLPPSSMYLTSPTVLTEPNIVANHGFEPSLCNYILPRVSETKRGVNSERLYQMLEPSSNQGSFPVFQPEERIRSFALMGSKSMGSINQNSPKTSSIGTGFPVPFHQGIDVGSSITRQVNPAQYLSQDNSKLTLGSRMNDGAVKFAGGSYNLSEHITSNNHHSPPPYKHDVSFMSYQMQKH